MPNQQQTTKPTETTQQHGSTTMHSTTTRNRSRRRIRRALVAALIPAALAATALPAVAQAGTVEEAAGGTLLYRAAAGEINNVSVTNPLSSAIEIRDLTGITSRTSLCAQASSIRVRCALGIRLSEVRLGDRNDGFAIGVPGAVVVDAGPGNDSYTAVNVTLSSSVDYRGGDGFDHVSYSNADRGVRLSNDGAANDGRIGFNRDNIRGDVEHLEGSAFGDEITAAARNGFGQRLTGGRGNDVLRDAAVRNRGLSPDTVFDMGRQADGADDIIGGSAHSEVDYSQRTQPVNLTLNFGGADDGEQVEGDEITGSHEFANGGQANDTIRAPVGSTAAHTLSGFAGNDRIEGAEGADTLSGFDSPARGTSGGDGADTILAFGGSDLVLARDGIGDIIGCGSGTDTAELDPNTVDVSSSCENRRVGVLRLAPKTLRVKAGEPARLRLSWRHPRSWRQLRQVQLRLYAGNDRVGAVTISPRGEQIKAAGAVSLARRASRLTRKGKKVSARLALRLDRQLAGKRLRLEVAAVDRGGARQLEPNAGSIRVAR
jgi:hypothetical protein